MNGTPTLPRATVALLAAALLAGCGSSPARSPQAPPPDAPPTLQAPDPDFESRALLLLLADRRIFEASALEAMIGGSPEVREALAVALGRIGDARGRSLLQGLLVDSEPEVRREAAFALGELGQRDAERALVVASVDDDAETGALAVEALGKLGVPLAGLRRALGALEPEEAWARLAPHLFRFKEPEAVAVAREALGRPEPEVRRGGAYALGREARPEGLEALRPLVTDADPFVRGWAARGLGEVGVLADLGRLEPLLADAVPSVRIQALRAGGKILGRAEALPPLGWGDRIAALAAESLPGFRATALEVAGGFLPHPALETALRTALHGGGPRERELALAALAAGRVADAAELLRAAAIDQDPFLRARAAEAAGRLGDADLVDRLRRDRSPTVRVAAVGALAALELPAASAPLLEALADRDPAVRASALDALALAPELGTDRVVRAIEAARADGADNDVRRTGIDVLVRRAKERPEADRPAALEALRALGADDDWLVRRAAADALVELGEPRPAVAPIETGKPLAAYREILAQTSAPRRVELTTERGRMVLELACPEAPMTCLSFLQLARAGLFDGNRIHRVVPDFVVQAGDPRGDGWGGPGYTLRDEINRLRYRRGALGMALSGPDTGGSQFFVTLSAQPHLDGGYTVFGRVVEGEETLDRIRQGDRIVGVRELGGPGDARAGGLR